MKEYDVDINCCMEYSTCFHAGSLSESKCKARNIDYFESWTTGNGAIFCSPYFLFPRVTSLSKAKLDMRVKKPVKPLSKGAPFGSRQGLHRMYPAKEQVEWLMSDADQNKND